MKKYLCLAVFLSLWALPAAALPDNDSNNTLTYDGQTVAGLEPIVAGHGQQNADGNTVTVSNSTIQDNNSPLRNAQVVGGWAVSGTANQNRVEITDSGTDTPIGNNVIGGYSPYLSETYLHDNTVEITGSRVSGLVAGAAGLGASWDITVRQPLRNDADTHGIGSIGLVATKHGLINGTSIQYRM